MVYEPRHYRLLQQGGAGLRYQVVVEETDLWISAPQDLSPSLLPLIRALRQQVQEAENAFPGFLRGLTPMSGHSPCPLIEGMLQGARQAKVGPMAAVAGAIAQAVGHAILKTTAPSRDVCVENGGDIYMDAETDRLVLIHAGSSPLSERVAIRLRADQFPLGICTSAGTVGHSLSFGKADAAMIVAKDAALADAVATAAGNHLKTPNHMADTLAFVQSVPGILGCVLIIQDQLGAWGDLELVPYSAFTSQSWA